MMSRVDGEFDLIAKLTAAVGRAATDTGPAEVLVASGDDAAVTLPGGATATSVDSLVEGVHFRRETSPLRSVGRKAIAAALSDLAAMGAEPGEAYVQLGVPADIDVEGALELGEGIGEAAAEHGVQVLGGDVSRAPVLWLGVTVVGHAATPADLVTRAGAKPGDVLVVTGELGGSGAGLMLLERPEIAQAVRPEQADALRSRHLEPSPRLRHGRALAGAGATAMIDLSDGLAGDAAHLALAGAVRLVVELDELPIAAGVAAVAEAVGVDPIELAAAAGEDYELLATIPAERVGEAVSALQALGVGLTRIGRVESGAGASLIDREGRERRLAGFDQLREVPSPAEPG
jgi:thiamine-monophosphate kinase